MNAFKIFSFFLSLLGLSAETLLNCNLSYGEEKYHHESLRYKKGEENISFTRLAFFLSEFSFQGVSGKLYPLPDHVFYLEAEKKRASSILPTPAQFPEEITAFHFSIGLPKKVNLSDPNQHPPSSPLNPTFNNLHWSQETGYIFMAIEGMTRPVQTKELRGYSLHYANTHNLLPISLKLPEKALSLGHLSLNLNLEELLKGISFYQDGYTTHSKPRDPLAEKIKENLTSSFRIIRLRGDLPELSKKKPKKTPLYLPKSKKHLEGFPLKIGRNLPLPDLPTDNPLLVTRVTLGKKLFHDPTLSADHTVSCATCHEKSAAFSQNAPLSTGINDAPGSRNSMPLFNLAWKNDFFWDGRAPSLRAQVLDPISDPHELGETLDNVENKLQKHPDYPTLFQAAFDSEKVTAERISLALEAFLLTLTSYDSRFDRALKGAEPLTAEEQRGFQLFMTEYEPRLGAQGADCFHCHGGALFTDNHYHNNGVGDASDLGRFIATGKDMDKGKFLTPSLRNISLTAPYMHDGRFKTLEEVVEHYSSGLKRHPDLAPLDANLAKHGGNGIPLSPADKRALVAFLKTLTDEKFLQ